MMQHRAEAIRARIAQFKKLPTSLRLLYAEKTIDEITMLLVEMAAALDDLQTERGQKHGR